MTSHVKCLQREFDQRGLRPFGVGEGQQELGSILSLARLDFLVGREKLPGMGQDVADDGLLLGFEPQAGLCLLLGRHPVVRDECLHVRVSVGFVTGCTGAAQNL